MAYKDTVKQWFQTNDIPTEPQFYQKFDYLRWKDEKIGTGDLTDELLAIINGIIGIGRPQRLILNADSSFVMQAEYKLNGVAARNLSSTDITLVFNYAGFGGGGGNWQELVVPAHGSADLTVMQTFWTQTTINITGITGGTYDVDYPIILLIDKK